MSDAPVTPIEFKVGDKVTWTDVTSKGGGFNLSSKEGVIAKIHPQAATVKLRNGRTKVVWFDDLRLAGAKTHLTEFFEGMAKASGGGAA